MPRRVLAVVAVAVFAVLAGASPAAAHTALVQSSPGDGSELATSPAEIVLRYSKRVTVLDGAVLVVAPDGEDVSAGQAEMGADGTEAVLPVRSALAPGAYTVLWRVLAQDNHALSGSFTFQVAPPSHSASASHGESPSDDIGHGSGAVSPATSHGLGVGAAEGRAVPLATDPARGSAEELLTASRGVLFGGLILLVGGVAFLLVLWPAGLALRSARGLLWLGWALAAVSSLGALVVQGPYALDLPVSRAFDRAVIDDVLRTRFGVITAIRVAVLALVVPLLVLVRRPSRPRLIATAAPLGLVLLVTTSAVGHAGVGDMVALSLVADVLHLAAASVWVGGLGVLVAVLLRQSDEVQLASVLQRWSRLAAGAVVVLVATGLFASWRQVREVTALAPTPYGRILIAKTAAVLGMLALGGLSRLLVRRLSGSTGSRAPLRRLRRGVLAEAGLAVAVLVMTALLVGATPSHTDEASTSGGPAHSASGVR